MIGCFVNRGGDAGINRVYGHGRWEEVARRLTLPDAVISRENLEERREFLREVELIMTTWGMEEFDRRTIREYFPNLKAVLYGAGSVRYFAQPFLECGVKVYSAWNEMAICVAEFTMSVILLANKGFFNAERLYRTIGYAEGQRLNNTLYPGNYEKTPIGIIGAGSIGRKTIELLRPFDVEVWVYDKFMSEEQIRAMRAVPHTLEEIFSGCQTISNHVANVPETVGMLDYRLFSMMKPEAAFINTGRGAQVVEADLVRAMRDEPTRCAVLDVTYPEPTPADGLLRSVPNIILLPHIAGASGNEVLRLSDTVIRMIDTYQSGGKVEGEVFPQMLATMM